MLSGIQREYRWLSMSFGDVDVVNACAMETQVDPVLVCFLTQMTTEWFLARVGSHVPLQVVRLGVSTPAYGTLEGFFARMGPNVNHQALLVRKRLTATGTDMRAIPAVGFPVLCQHTLRHEAGAALADKGTIARMLADVLRQLGFLAERALAHGTGERFDAEVAHLVGRQLDLLHERPAAGFAGMRTFSRMQFVMHSER